MEALLLNAFINPEKPDVFNEVIRVFKTVKDKRNDLAHGLWFTHESGRVFLADPSTDMKQMIAAKRREVPIPELKEDIRRMQRLAALIDQAVGWVDPNPIPVGKVRMRLRFGAKKSGEQS